MTSYWTRQLRLLPTLLLVLSALVACKDKEKSAESDEAPSGQAPLVDAEPGAFDEAAPGTETVHVAAAQRRAIIPSVPPLDISAFLTGEDVTPYLKGKGLKGETLVGQKPGPTYNAVHFKSGPGAQL